MSLVPEHGQRVRVKDGPFEDFAAVVVEVDRHRAKATLRVDMFGRWTLVDLDFAQLDASDLGR